MASAGCVSRLAGARHDYIQIPAWQHGRLAGSSESIERAPIHGVSTDGRYASRAVAVEIASDKGGRTLDDRRAAIRDAGQRSQTKSQMVREQRSRATGWCDYYYYYLNQPPPYAWVTTIPIDSRPTASIFLQRVPRWPHLQARSKRRRRATKPVAPFGDAQGRIVGRHPLGVRNKTPPPSTLAAPHARVCHDCITLTW